MNLNDLADRLMGLLARVRQAGFGEHPLQNSKIAPPQLNLLDWIAESPGCGITQVADGLRLTPATVSVAVSHLEAAGLWERQPDPADGRAVRLHVTQMGQQLHQEAQSFRRQKMASMLDSLTRQERETLLSLLERAIESPEKGSESH